MRAVNAVRLDGAASVENAVFVGLRRFGKETGRGEWVGWGGKAWVDNDRTKCSLSLQFPFLLDPGPGLAAAVV